MPDRRAVFRDDVGRVTNDANKASDDLVRRLKMLTPGEFLRQPRQVFDRMTLGQYNDVVATIAPQVELPAVETDDADEATNRPGALTMWWRQRSAWAQSTIITLIAATIFSAMGVMTPVVIKLTLSHQEVVRPVKTVNWPVCKRLSEYTDGCVYYPTQSLNWEWVAQELDLPEKVLRRNNRHLPPQWIPANAHLVIWRERGRLEN